MEAVQTTITTFLKQWVVQTTSTTPCFHRTSIPGKIKVLIDKEIFLKVSKTKNTIFALKMMTLLAERATSIIPNLTSTILSKTSLVF